MIIKQQFDELRTELSIKAKNGLDFTLSAGIIWLLIGFIWTMEKTTYSKSILTFYAGVLMLPLAFLFSRILKTTWTAKNNPLQPFGLWLNFAQLFYFPFLLFTLSKMPDYFVMVYVIITGGHFFTYSWFYKNKWFAITAGISVVGALLLGLNLKIEEFYLIPLFFSTLLIILTVLLYFDFKKKELIKYKNKDLNTLNEIKYDFYCEEALSGKTKIDILFESKDVLAFYHTKPFWEKHIVVIPKKHIKDLISVSDEDMQIITQIMKVARDLAKDLDLTEGVKVLTNLGKFQDTPHVHFHLAQGKEIR